MRQLSASLLALTLGGAAAVALVSCGSGSDADLLPGGTASEINANLDMVRELADSGDCAGAQSAAQQVSDQIDALGGVDKQLKQALRDGAERLGEVVANCVETTTEAIAPATIPETTETTTKPSKEKKPKEDKGEGNGKDGEDEEPTTPTTTTPPTDVPPTDTPPVPPAPPAAGGGTGAPGGVAPGAPVGEGDG
jgi:hypothetical protein